VTNQPHHPTDESDAIAATFMFADIAGFTALTEAHGDQEAVKLVGDSCDAVEAELPAYLAGHRSRRSETRSCCTSPILERLCFSDCGSLTTSFRVTAHQRCASVCTTDLRSNGRVTRSVLR